MQLQRTAEDGKEHAEVNIQIWGRYMVETSMNSPGGLYLITGITEAKLADKVEVQETQGEDSAF